ncbi:MAG: hypothetical protein FWD18_04485 [Micrococcales bacterium]|nr:hypothetical protein [Micrococcales bacterium]
MSEQNKPDWEPLDPNATYYAVYRHGGDGRVVGIERRKPLCLPGLPDSTSDEVYTRNLRWEPSTFFIDPLFGKGDDEPYEEITLEDAERIAKGFYDASTLPVE